jgi:hypothetical protein
MLYLSNEVPSLDLKWVLRVMLARPPQEE